MCKSNSVLPQVDEEELGTPLSSWRQCSDALFFDPWKVQCALQLAAQVTVALGASVVVYALALPGQDILKGWLEIGLLCVLFVYAFNGISYACTGRVLLCHRHGH